MAATKSVSNGSKTARVEYDIKHYQRVVAALQETIQLMEETIEMAGGWPIK